jgi:hypothetical protein
MDDQTKGLGDEKMAGLGDENIAGLGDEDVTGRAGNNTPRARSSANERTKDLGEDRLRPKNVAASAAAGVLDTASATASNAAATIRDTASAAAATVRNAASETLNDSRVVQQVRENPIPAAMVGVGIAGLVWLAFGNRNRQSQTRRPRRFANAPGSYEVIKAAGYNERGEYYYTDETGGVGGVERAKELGSTTGGYARDVAAKARQTTRRAQSQLQRAINENPLFVGAAALATGAMIGMALPETERENELMGETRDAVVEEAQDKARTAATRVQQAASEAAKKVQDVAADAVGLAGTDQ